MSRREGGSLRLWRYLRRNWVLMGAVLFLGADVVAVVLNLRQLSTLWGYEFWLIVGGGSFFAWRIVLFMVVSVRGHRVIQLRCDLDGLAERVDRIEADTRAPGTPPARLRP